MGYYSTDNYIYLPSICNRKGIKINFSNIKGLLLDLEGVVYEGDKLVDGALDAINELLSCDLKIKYLTNTTVTPRKQILKKLLKFKLSVIEADIFTPPIAASIFLKKNKISKIFLLTNYYHTALKLNILLILPCHPEKKF